jgi:hypothetical protein
MPQSTIVDLTVIGSILLASDEGLRMEETAVGSRADLVDHVGLEIDVQGAGYVLARRRLREEGAETLRRVLRCAVR